MYELDKYKGKWAVFDTKSCVWYFIGSGKNFCIKKIKELNNMEDVC